jgi:DNA mismatch repair protein MutL
MPPIRVLPVHLVNQIAAGEVIERPASVVKELVENALDAEAGRIEVAVEDGGKKLIQVTDDGRGMPAKDVALAFVPHATSKLACEDDLFRIGTMGFRGEALASVASVSHARLRSRRRDEADDAGGCEIDASGEMVGEARPCPAAPGTTVTVRDLFYNTPARRRFLRSATTEMGHVTEQITRLALPHPHVAWRLLHNGRELRNLPPTDSTARRVGDLFDPALADVLLPLARRSGPVEVAGLVAPPAEARATSKWQYFFLNGRYIRDRLLSHALREAFRGRIEPNRWPVAFVFLQMDPGEVDVNVHPTKIEVRFRNSQAVHGELLASLKETLNRANLAPSAVVSSPAAAPVGGEQGADRAAGVPDEQRRESLRQALADFFKSAPPPQPRLSFPESTPPRRPAPGAGPPAPAPREAPTPLLGQSPQAQTPAVSAAAAPTAPPAEEPEAAGPTPPPATVPPVPKAMQIHNSYIVSAVADGLVIVDQHALHERVLYNELHDRLAEGRLAGQRLLIPQTLRVTPAEADRLAARQALLERLGIEAVPFGPETVAVQQFPSLLAERGVAPSEFLRELLDRLAEDETTDSERLLEDVLAMMACKAAVKAGEPLTPGEIDSLLARGRDVEKASSCPHGRPTTLRLTLRDLEKQFRRT